jgi:hypothetical protein
MRRVGCRRFLALQTTRTTHVRREKGNRRKAEEPGRGVADRKRRNSFLGEGVRQDVLVENNRRKPHSNRRTRDAKATQIDEFST